MRSRYVAVAGNRRGAGTCQRVVGTEKEVVRREAAREGEIALTAAEGARRGKQVAPTDVEDEPAKV